MKPKQLLPAVMLLLLFSQHSFASGGNIMGQVVDTTNKLPLIDATVVLDCKGNQQSVMTNEHGYYYASNIPAGAYTIIVVNHGTTYKMAVNLATDQTREVNFNVSDVVDMPTIEVHYVEPVIDPVDPTKHILDRKQICEMPITKIAELAVNEPGVEEFNGQYYVHGARAGGLAYYVDGCKVLGDPGIPLCGLDSYRSYTDFIPAKYGDVTGGVIAIETRNYFKQNR